MSERPDRVRRQRREVGLRLRQVAGLRDDAGDFGQFRQTFRDRLGVAQEEGGAAGDAKARSRTDSLPALVPNLVEAMFTNFPGRSGEEVKITIPPPPKG